MIRRRTTFVRVAFRVSVWTAVGAAVTALAAWGLTKVAEDGGYGVYTDAAALRWPVKVPTNWPQAPKVHEHGIYFWLASEDPWIEVRFARVSSLEASTDFDRFSVTRFSAGWPLPALACFLLQSSSEFQTGRTYEYRNALRLSETPYYPPTGSLPLLPLWPGFAVDSAFYGTLAFLLWSAPGFVRRQRRRRRGLCLACGYELKGLEKCPECGRAVTQGKTMKAPDCSGALS